MIDGYWLRLMLFLRKFVVEVEQPLRLYLERAEITCWGSEFPIYALRVRLGLVNGKLQNMVGNSWQISLNKGYVTANGIDC